MADYNAIKGRLVQTLSSDPTLASSYEGQVWYNSTEGVLKGLVQLEAFTSSASLGTGRYQAMWAGEGTQNATLLCSGRSAAPAIVNLTEEYNGSGWAAGGNCNNAENSCAGFGTQTAAIKSGGYPGSDPDGLATESESYNGTAWTSGNAISPGRQGHVGAGVETAGVIFGGNDGTILNKTEEFDGTNFSNVNNMNTGRQNLSGVGVQTAALAAGGGTTPITNAAESYDGTNWTTLASMNTARQGLGGFGTSTSAAVTGGSAPYKSATETWDGTTWSTSPATLATARAFFGDCGAGSSTAGIVAGGIISPGVIAITEEYNKSLNVFTAGAWASGSNMNTGRGRMGGFGIQTAAVAAGGYIGPPGPNTNQGENYNGTTWSVSGSPSQTNNSQNATGTQTAGILISGGNPYVNVVQTYNGSTYSTAPFSTNTRRGNGGACGTQTAGLFFAGYSSTTPPHTGPGSNGWSEEYDGEGFTNTNLMVTGRSYVVAAGSQTAALSAGGGNGPTPSGSVCEEFDGTNWTTVNNMPTTTGSGAGGGTQTAAWYAGGSTGGPGTITTAGYTYDGTNWSSSPSLGTSRYILSAADSAPNTTGLVFGGFIPSPFTGMNNTEEFTGEAVVTTASTLTTS